MAPVAPVDSVNLTAQGTNAGLSTATPNVFAGFGHRYSATPAVTATTSMPFADAAAAGTSSPATAATPREHVPSSRHHCPCQALDVPVTTSAATRAVRSWALLEKSAAAKDWHKVIKLGGSATGMSGGLIVGEKFKVPKSYNFLMKKLRKVLVGKEIPPISIMQITKIKEM
ncbi:hypothetical protein FPQ18DRAFT_392739 [Pyronema domesticum]|nr:hypothetical protein FPQ18DRAFT_392739 [Pyronema domesticum]